MEKALKELVLALKSIANALMGKVNSSNNTDEGGLIRNYNTVVGVKGIGYVTNKYDIQHIIEETPVFLFDKTKSLSENFKLFCSQNIEFMNSYLERYHGGLQDSTHYNLLPVYENNDNKNLYDFDTFGINICDITDEYDYDDLSEFLSSENCELYVDCYNMRDSWNPTVRELIDFIPVDNKHYIIFYNNYLTLHSNNYNPVDDVPNRKR